MKRPTERGNGKMPLLKDTETIIKDFKRKHGDRYDYSLVDYKGSDCPVEIICTTHGVFKQRADQHRSGNNCPKCAKKYKPTNDEFINECMQIFKNKFTYEKTQYKNVRTKITVTCITHGDFKVLPYNHKNSQHGGCPKCSPNGKLTLQDFISQAKIVHKVGYIYDRVSWSNTRAKITIGCQKHGYFTQIADQHLRGRGCPKCAIDTNKKATTMTVEEFISIATDFHGNKYDYSQIIYQNSYTKIKIICPFHGEF